MKSSATQSFDTLINQISEIGLKRHTKDLIEHAQTNLSFMKQTVKDVPLPQGEKAKSGIIISAGPSVKRQKSIQRILDAGYKGTVIAVDGAFIACLKAGLSPDYVLTLDPHKTRIVRWFGDHNFEEHTRHDDYFTRQDLDVDFRKNSIEHNEKNIELVNEKGRLTKAIISTSSPKNVVQRLQEANVNMYWWNPLVDNPVNPESVTRQLYNINSAPCMNTGGNVGTASWVFADSILKLPKIALTGMDLGYYHDTPLNETQTYYELIQHLGTDENLEEYYPKFENPSTGEKYYTDPTYFWYRKNFLELYRRGNSETYNCTEGGVLFDEYLKCMTLDEFLRMI